MGIREVAERAGVSQATVSRVLNDRPGVSPESRRAVETAVRQLGMRREGRLRSGGGPLVTLVMPTLLDPFFATLAHEAAHHLGEGGARILMLETGHHGTHNEARAVRELLQSGVQGLVFLGGNHNESCATHDPLTSLTDAGVPVVLVNAGVPGIEVDRVMCDDRTQAQLAWTHLRGLGHRRVGVLLGSPDHLPSLLKARALTELTQGVPGVRVDVRWTDSSVASAQAEAATLLAGGSTALVAASTDLAIGALLAARRAGLRIPDDLSLIAFSESMAFTVTEPAITEVRQPVSDMASAAARCLLDALERPHRPRLLVHEPELVLRESTARPRPGC